MAIRARNTLEPETDDDALATRATALRHREIALVGARGGLQGVILLTLLGLGPVATWPAQGQTLFPGVTGQALLDSLVASYKPASTLSYASARDTLFAVVLNAGDDSPSVCVHGPHPLPGSR